MDFANNFPAIIGVLVFVAIAVLMARGGSKNTKKAPTYRVSLYGNSATKGGFFDMSTIPPTLRQYSPDPAALLEMASGGRLRCANRAQNGMQLHELLRGGPIEMGAGTGLGESGQALHFVAQLSVDDADLVVLHFGEVESMFTGMDLTAFRISVRQAARRVEEFGKRLAICGLIRFAINETVTYDMHARRDAFNIALRMEADDLGVPFIDLDGAGEAEVCGDGLHPSGAYHERLARHAMPQILALFKEETHGTV